jgi:hypothetical protein
MILLPFLNYCEYLIGGTTMTRLLIICQVQGVQFLASAANQDMETLVCARRLGHKQPCSFSIMGHERPVLETR